MTGEIYPPKPVVGVSGRLSYNTSDKSDRYTTIRAMNRTATVVKVEIKQMPIYCYRCEACGFGFEKLVTVSEKEPESCPKCRGKSKKEFAPFSIGRGSSTSPASGESSCAGCRSGSCGSCNSCHH